MTLGMHLVRAWCFVWGHREVELFGRRCIRCDARYNFLTSKWRRQS
jgi:hypothetical protein